MTQRFLVPLLRSERDNVSRTIDTPDGWRAKREDIRERFYSVVGEAPFEEPPPLGVEIGEPITGDMYTRRRVTYTVEPPLSGHPAERVAAWLLVPNGDPMPRAAVLCLHQTVAEGKDEAAGLAGAPDLAYTDHLARRGFVTFAPDHVTAGERIAPGLNAYDTAAFYEKHPDWSAVGKAIWDASRALDVMSALPEVDASRIGAIGHSLGGHSAVFAAAFDNRIRACVTNCGLTTFADNPKRLAWARDAWYIYIKRLRPAFLAGLDAPFDFHEIAALIAPRALLNITALNDGIMGISTRAMTELTAEVRSVYELLGAEERFGTYLHGNDHSFPSESRELAYAWLERMLGA